MKESPYFKFCYYLFFLFYILDCSKNPLYISSLEDLCGRNEMFVRKK